MATDLLTKEQIAKAIDYNTRKSGVLWHEDDISLGSLGSKVFPPSTRGFALAVARFQQKHDLVVDGSLGPETFAMLRAVAQGTAATLGNADVPSASAVPSPVGISNRIIVDGVPRLMPEALLQAGLTCTNWLNDQQSHEDVHFKSSPRNRVVTHIVIHESVTNSVTATADTLLAKGYGVHFSIAPDGHIACHNDPVKEYVIHGNQLNGCSVGIEVINPYSPLYDKPPYEKTITGRMVDLGPDRGEAVLLRPDGSATAGAARPGDMALPVDPDAYVCLPDRRSRCEAPEDPRVGCPHQGETGAGDRGPPGLLFACGRPL
jgi:hypothetical protein